MSSLGRWGAKRAVSSVECLEMATNTEDRVLSNNPDSDILPIFVTDYTYERPPLISHEGTGFLLGKNILVTCWHCVRAELKQGLIYAALEQHGNEQYTLHPLVDLEQDPSGMDLATARVGLEPSMGLTLAKGPVASYGTDIWSFGYPLTRVEAQPASQEGKRFTLNGRYMESYVMRTFSNDWPEFGRVASYELDMPALSGMSGAPIIRVGSREVIGVLYGRNDAETIEEFSSRDPETGARTPEVVRMTSFAVAHFTDTLRELRGQATQNLPLAEYLIT